jgi:hypothetical protein
MPTTRGPLSTTVLLVGSTDALALADPARSPPAVIQLSVPVRRVHLDAASSVGRAAIARKRGGLTRRPRPMHL